MRSPPDAWLGNWKQAPATSGSSLPGTISQPLAVIVAVSRETRAIVRQPGTLGDAAGAGQPSYCSAGLPSNHFGTTGLPSRGSRL